MKPIRWLHAGLLASFGLAFFAPEPLKTYFGAVIGIVIGLNLVGAGLGGKRCARWLTGVEDFPNWAENAFANWSLAFWGAVAVVISIMQTALLFDRA